MSTNTPGFLDDWIIYEGQPFNEVITALEGDDEATATAIDWTGFTGEIRIGVDRSSSSLLETSVTHGDVSGVIIIDLTVANITTIGSGISEDTRLQYDLWMTSGVGVPQLVLTGKLLFKPEVPDS